ncbi:MAG TPA: translocation/assembly module TamB domain-containing protein, partial [Candidatus Eremiobacteraceae bacterium]|nr:translocation/assembly module TamB domain-containing protein [Candidatus Eremiobacteraceae bacterium]
TVLVTALDSRLYYHDGHVVVLSTNATYDGASLHGDGDIDLTTAPVSGQFDSNALVAADRLPVVAQLTPRATARLNATFAGPLSQMTGEGFADIRGGRTRVQAALEATSSELAFSSIAKDRRGGELFAGGRIERSAGGIAGDVIARDFALRIDGRPVSFPGLSHTAIRLPQSAARLDGAASIRGTRADPVGSVAMSAAHVQINTGISGLPVDGLERSSIEGVINGRAWLGDIAASGAHMHVAGVSMSDLHGIIAGSGRRIHAGEGTARIGGGHVAIEGRPPSDRSGSMSIYVSEVDGSVLRNVGVPLAAGRLTAIARITGTARRPVWSLRGVMRDGVFAGHAISGDGVFLSDGGTIRTNGARVAMDGNLAYVDGALHNVGSRSATAPTLDADVRVPNGDLGALSSVSGNSSADVAGLAAVAMHVGGSMGAPQIAGRVISEIGTVRGVTYQDLYATVTNHDNGFGIQDAGVRFGSTRLQLAGAFGPSAIGLRVASPHVDLADFNDFFDGKDVLVGHGSLAVALTSDQSRTEAQGAVRLRDVRIEGVPAGAVDIAFSPSGGYTSAAIRQFSALSAAQLNAAVYVRPQGAPLSDFGSAQFSLDGSIRAADLAAIAPYVGAEDRHIGGRFMTTLHARGPLHSIAWSAAVKLDHATMQGVAINSATGYVSASPAYLDLRSMHADAEGMVVSASGRLDRKSGAISARAHAAIADVAMAARLAQIPGATRGAAVVDVATGGTLARPSVALRASAANGQIRGVAFDSMSLAAHYGDGRLQTHGVVALARNGGSIDAKGTIPIRLRPFAIGPNRAPVALQLRAVAVDLSMLNPLIGDVTSIHGSADAGVVVSGTAGEPAVAGSAQLRNTALASRFDTIGARDVNADVTFANDTISLRTFHARLGDGSLVAHGEAHIVPATAMHQAPNLQFAMRAALDGAQVDVPNMVNAKISGGISLTKSGRIPYLDGNINLNDTSVPFASLLALASRGSTSPPPDAALPGVPKPLPGRVVGYAGSIYGGTFKLVTNTPRRHRIRRLLPHTFDLGLQVHAGQNVGVTGAISALGTGSVAVSGTTRSPKLAGTLTAVRGRAGFLNTRFNLNDGTVTFDHADGLLPTIAADATTSTDTADITVTIVGRVDQLHTSFSSNPAMSNDAIAASLLQIPQINSALASSHGVDQSQFGVAAQNVVTGAIAGQVLGALNAGLEGLFNVGEVNFELDPAGHPGLELRQQFGPHAYSVYKTTFSVPPAQAFGVIYQLRRALQVEFTQTQSTPGLSAVVTPPQTSLQVQISFH